MLNDSLRLRTHSRRKVTTSSRSMQAAIASLSQRAFERRRFCWWRRIVLAKHRATLAVWSPVSPWSPCNLLFIMFRVSSCVETAKFSAIIVVESSTLDGQMPELSVSFSGLGQIYIRSSGDTKHKGRCVQNCLKTLGRQDTDPTLSCIVALFVRELCQVHYPGNCEIFYLGDAGGEEGLDAEDTGHRDRCELFLLFVPVNDRCLLT
jgi:hypothetical protein